MMMLARRPAVATATAIADTISLYLALALLAALLMSSLGDDSAMAVAGGRFTGGRPCEEIYVVGEGETLHTISDKCGDSFIVERNPHINDPDDVFPGLVIMLNPQPSPKLNQNQRRLY